MVLLSSYHSVPVVALVKKTCTVYYDFNQVSRIVSFSGYDSSLRMHKVVIK